MNIPSVSLSENEFLIRTSNRITHESPGALSKPCGFYAEVIEGNGELNESAITVEEKMSSIAGSVEARAREKLVQNLMDFIAERRHGIYTHEYYKAELDHLKLLEWFRMNRLSAREYLNAGFPELLTRCEGTKRVLEESFPEPSEVYDYIPDGYGIKSIYNEIYRMLKKEMLSASTDLESALASARLNDKIVVNVGDYSYKQRQALGLQKNESRVNLHRVFRDRCEGLLEPVREIIPIIKKCCDEKKQ